MMFFQKNTSISPIRSFQANISSGGHDNPIAFGPGSIISGSLMLTLDKPLSAYSMRVIFKCEESDSSKKSTTIFSVESVIWGEVQATGVQTQCLAEGSHMYLFAIRLPHVNYPPSMSDYYFGHRIIYTLYGVLNMPSSDNYTNTVPIIYLPLITCPPEYIAQTSRTSEVFVIENGVIETSVELIKPSYCPGDHCTLKMITNNKSDTKINHVQLMLSAISSTNSPNTPATSDQTHVQKKHILLTESFFVSIPKQARDHHDIFRFQIPIHIVPSFTNKLGKYIDISYEITISIPVTVSSHSNTSWFNSTVSVDNILSLPIPITTIPPGYPIEVDVEEADSSELPCFIPNIESPFQSPSMTPEDYDYSVSPLSPFPIDNGEDVEDNFQLHSDAQSLQDDAGYLVVPNGIRRKSNSSTSTTSTNSIETGTSGIQITTTVS
ncbi:hypothetical protein BDB01DRAFT_785957 [Pilobolus umbonatus]|nr:hypothetical protein BDB01DRAFT_785957 [Pilobolus umbonatus]